MTPELLAGLRALAEALPPGAAVPVPPLVLLELLDGNAAQPAPLASAHVGVLSVGELATRYHRRPSTVRGWLERGLFPGAFKLRGRAWRIPAASLRTFEERQGEAGRREPTPVARRKAVDLSAWRQTG